MSLGENSLVEAYQGRGQLKSRPSGTRVVTSSFLIVLISAQRHTSNQCFHHSFLEASSLFSILPLVILSSWKRLLSHCYPGASILGAEGRDPQILCRGVAGIEPCAGRAAPPPPTICGRRRRRLLLIGAPPPPPIICRR